MIHQNFQQFNLMVDCLYLKIGSELPRNYSNSNAYSSCYKYVIKAHLLSAICKFFEILSFQISEERTLEIFEFEVQKLEIIEDSFIAKESLLSFIRNTIVFFISNSQNLSASLDEQLKEIIGKLYIKSAKLSLSICPQISYTFLLKSKIYDAIEFNYTMACWQWKYGDRFEAQRRLIDYIEEFKVYNLRSFKRSGSSSGESKDVRSSSNLVI